MMGATDSPPSLRINPYWLCETSLVLVVIAIVSWCGVFVWGSTIGRLSLASIGVSSPLMLVVGGGQEHRAVSMPRGVEVYSG